MRRYFTDLEAACAQIDATHEIASARLSAMIDRYRDALEGGKSVCLCVSFSTSRESLPEDVIAQISRFRAMMLGWLDRVFRAGKADGSIQGVTEPDLEAAATLPMLEGAHLAARAEENPELFDNALQLLVQRLR